MSTIAKTASSVKNATKEKTEVTKISRKIDWEKIEEARFGIIPILLTAICCMGGGVAAFGTSSYEVLQLSMVVIPTMVVLTSILAVAPMKAIIYSSAIALISYLLVILI